MGTQLNVKGVKKSEFNNMKEIMFSEPQIQNLEFKIPFKIP